MRPIPSIICAVVAIQHIIARVLQIFCGFQPLFEISARFRVVVPFAGQRAGAESLRLGYDGITQRNGIIAAAAFLDRLYDFHRKAIAIFKRTAVFIGTFVHIRQGKLVEKISLVHGVYFHTVHARFLTLFRNARETVHDIGNFLKRHRTAGHFVRPAVGRGGRSHGQPVHVDYGLEHTAKQFICINHFGKPADRKGTPEARRDLHEELRTGFMYFIHERLQLFKFPLALIKPPVSDEIAYRRNARNNQSAVVFRDV